MFRAILSGPGDKYHQYKEEIIELLHKCLTFPNSIEVSTNPQNSNTWGIQLFEQDFISFPSSSALI